MVLQVHGEYLRGNASLRFVSSMPHLSHPHPSPGRPRGRPTQPCISAHVHAHSQTHTCEHTCSLPQMGTEKQTNPDTHSCTHMHGPTPVPPCLHICVHTHTCAISLEAAPQLPCPAGLGAPAKRSSEGVLPPPDTTLICHFNSARSHSLE